MSDSWSDDAEAKIAPIQTELPGLRVTVDSWDRRLILNCRVYADDSTEWKAMFLLEELPGCCGVLVSMHTSIAPKSRGGSLAKELMNAKVALAKAFGFGLLLATVVEGNDKEEAGLYKAGWNKEHGQFINPKTGRKIATWTLVVSEYKERK